VTPIVVDSSVALKWFVPEVLSDRAARLLDGRHELLAPDLLIPECGNVLWKKIARGEISMEDARAILQAIVRAPIRIVPSGALAEGALEIASAFRRSLYDGLFVALAVAGDCELVTADTRLVTALRAGPLAVQVTALSELDAAETPQPPHWPSPRNSSFR
jgi:predicted nucleic acid-binding protein